MKDQVDKYLAHLDKIFNREPVYTKISNSGVLKSSCGADL